MLAREVESVTQDEIRLRSGVEIATHVNSFRSVRGRTILAAIFDEVVYWRDDASANPDKEVYRAVLPSLAASGGPLVAISTPYRKTGLLHAGRTIRTSSLFRALRRFSIRRYSKR